MGVEAEESNKENEEKALTPEEEKEKKRAEIAAKVAALKAEREKAAALEAFQEAKKKEIEEKGAASYYGEHQGITCDACAVVPIFGYRYACKSCASHDVCESCYDAWAGGTGLLPCAPQSARDD